MGKTRKVYPSDVTEEEWWFVLPYLLLCREDAGQREHDLRDVFDAVRYVARSGCAWRMIPGDLPPWAAVYQQFRRWLDAGVFEALVSDVQSIAREWAGRTGQPSRQNGRVGLCRPGLHWTQRGGGCAEPRHTSRSGQASHGKTRLRAAAAPLGRGTLLCLARDYERLPQTLKRIHFIAFAILMTSRLITLATS